MVSFRMLQRYSLVALSLVLSFSLAMSGCGGSSSSTSPSSPTTTPRQMGGGIQGQFLSLSGIVSTFAGADVTVPRFFPYSSTSDGTNLYVTDATNHTIRKIVIATGAVSTFAGTAGVSGSTDGTGTAASFYGPRGITNDGTNLYVADSYNHTIRKIVIATGVVSTLAGSAGTSGTTDATGTAARFNYPYGLTTDGTNLYVADTSNHTIRQIVIATGVVTTLAGSAGVSGAADGTGIAASFYYPYGLISDGTNLYVADTYNHTIRKIVIATGVVTTLAGSAGTSGSTDATGTAARFNNPEGLAFDGTNTNLYVADSSNNTIRQIVVATGVVTTLAGSTGVFGANDGTGTAAMFYNPWGLTSDGTNLYVADRNNRSIRMVVIATGAVTTLAAGGSGTTDGTGTAARFHLPREIASDGTNLYVADSSNNTIRKIEIATGLVTTLAGSAGNTGSTDGIGPAASFNFPHGLTTDGTNLYVADSYNHTIRKIVIATGAVSTLAGSAGVSGSTDGIGPAASFNTPYGLTTDGTNLYVADSYNHTIREIVIASGAVTTLAGSAGSTGSTDGIGAAARFNIPYGLNTEGTNLYVADWGNRTIRKIDIASGAVTTLAGSAGLSGSTDGLGTAARFAGPEGITSDGATLYVADANNNTIRRIVIATGMVSTVAGSAGLQGMADGTGSAARFSFPQSVCTDGTSLFVADAFNDAIREIR